MIMFSKLLAARRSLRGTEGDSADLDQMVQVIWRLDARRHGFGGADLAAIESAWIASDETGWSGGFVALLADGRRASVGGRAVAGQWEEHAQLEVALHDDVSYPEIQRRHGWQEHASDPIVARELNELISKVADIARKEPPTGGPARTAQ
jgi:hypothetical protein